MWFRLPFAVLPDARNFLFLEEMTLEEVLDIHVLASSRRTTLGLRDGREGDPSKVLREGQRDLAKDGGQRGVGMADGRSSMAGS